jgi:hypothetical protein
MRRSLTISVVIASIGLGAACAAPQEEGAESSAAALDTRTRVMLVPQDEGARVSCRAAATRYTCDAASANAAVDACAGPGGRARVKLDVRAGSCTAPAPIYPTPASCERPVRLTCAFYAGCLERALPCGEGGYALGFGDRFCNAFRRSSMGPEGRAWVEGVMGCLQRELVPRVRAAGAFADSPSAPRPSAATCAAIGEDAFASHPGCYTHPDHSICFLPPSDIAAVLETIGLPELAQQRTREQVRATIGICTAQIARRLFGLDAARSTVRPSAALAAGDEREQREELRDVWADADARWRGAVDAAAGPTP